jgi:cobalt-zinc-cadmium efflux system protein
VQHITKHGSSRKRLLSALFLGVAYFFVVAIGSLMSGSLALLAIAGHMMLHNGALIIGVIATTFAMKAPNEKFSSGYNKVEAIGGYTNGLLLLGVSIWVLAKAFGFFNEHGHDEHVINTSITGITAAIGLTLHAFSCAILYNGRKDNLCVKAAYYHIFFDVIGVVAALAVSVYVHYTGQHEADLIVAALIGLLIFYNAVHIIKSAMILLLDGTPSNIEYKDIVKTLKRVPHIVDVHNLILRRKDSTSLELSAHLVMHQNCLHAHHWNDCRIDAEKALKKAYNIDYCILQLESADVCKHDHGDD